MRGVGRDLIRGGHYGQRSCEPHQKAEHMAAPTNAAKLEKSSCQLGAVHTWRKADPRVRCQRPLSDLALALTKECSYASFKACAMSAIRSDGCSMPIDSRIVESRTPIFWRMSAGTPEWVMLAGRLVWGLYGAFFVKGASRQSGR